MHEEAYDALRRYLDDARARLAGDPDQAEVIRDLEGSIAARVALRLAGQDRVLAIEDIEAVLGEVGPVEEGTTTPARATATPSTPMTASAAGKRRKLYRIKEGQDLAGVCVGLAAYTEIDLGWVRTIFFFAILLTAGLFMIVYLAMAFLLPVVPTYDAWLAALEDQPAPA